jgi:SAM-dependent methyltransferase
LARVGAAAEQNRSFFDDAAVVIGYRASEGLTPCESALFDRYLDTGMDILDLGVGAGRTTAVLLPDARRYVGIDVVAAMVDACRERHPQADIRQGDASDLSAFDDESFDVVVFSFNGLDCLHPIEQRARCMAEMHRVLRRGGVALLSSHNIHAFIRPVPRAPGVAGAASRVAKQIYAATRIVRGTVAGGAFWRGGGYVRDSATPLVLYMCSRRRMAQAAVEAGFTVEYVLGSDHLRPPRAISSAWFYYALRRSPER